MPNNPQVNSDYKIVAPPSPPAFTPEWALFRFLDGWAPEDLEIAIRKNVEVDFSSSLSMVEDYVTTEILKKFETYRPDLHQVLSKDASKKWLKTQIHRSITQK